MAADDSLVLNRIDNPIRTMALASTQCHRNQLTPTCNNTVNHKHGLVNEYSRGNSHNVWWKKEEIEASRDDKRLEGKQIQSNSHFNKNIEKNKKSQQYRQKSTGQDIPNKESLPKDQPKCLGTSGGCGDNNSSDKIAKSNTSLHGTFSKSMAVDGGLRSLIRRPEGVTVEKRCPKEFHNCSGSYHCLKSNQKIPHSQVCDGSNQCPQAEDEKACSTQMDPFCLCLGLRMTASKVIPSDAFFDVSDKPLLFNMNSRVYPIKSNQNVLLLSKAKYISFNNFRDTIPKNMFSIFPKVVHLNLSYSNIQYLRDELFIGISNLRQLDLSHNNIKRLSAAVFSGMSSLQILDLSYNKIRNLHDNVFSELSGLLYLNLSHNREDELFKKSLRSSISYGFRDSKHYNIRVLTLTSSVFNGLNNLIHLDLSSNDLANIPVYLFEELSSLKNLDLTNNLIGFWGLRNNMFFGLSGLRNLYLSHNMISYFPDYMFNGLFNLSNLDLSYNILSDSADNLLDRLTSLCDLDLPRISRSFLHDHMFNGLNRLGHLNLSHNVIQLDLPYSIFNGLSSLLTLDLSYNKIQTFPGHAFDGIPCVVNIRLSYNGVKNISLEAFRNLGRLKHLDFSHNEILFTADHKFNGSSSLRKLDLSHNKIVSIFDHIFSEMTSLTVLYLSHNNILVLPGDTFDGLFNIQILIISYNRLTNISTEAFSRLYNLLTLDLSHNDITTTPTFPFKAKISKLDLSYNDLTSLQPGSFFNCHRMMSLNVIGNPLEVQEHMFDGLDTLKFLFTDTLFACCVKPKSVGDDKCLAAECFTSSCEAAQSDAISSCQTLIRSEVLRIFLWIIGVCAVVGNAIVIVYRVILDRDNITKSYSVFVLNLGISDFFMGVYLSIIGTVDAYYKGVYALNATEWKESLLCSLAGVLSTVSSEMSTFIVLLVTIDRLIAIVFPMSRHTGRSITWKHATVVCVILWIFSIILAVIPTFLVQSYFKGQFYSQSGVCLALPLTAQKQTGSEYSAAVFVGLNSVIFVVILVGQIVIFISLKRRRNISSQSQRRDLEVAKTLFLVVATDFCCWCPIGVMGVMSLYGFQIPDYVYAWVMVFVLPVNAAVNPFLYTLTSIWRRRRANTASRTTTIPLQIRTTMAIPGANA
ncbi:hypothetical protein KP79_PYT00222 [Mizuhopecten yessoensis]|uniref:G-protein coupled receptors family 1 profile domain-containing protein n=1 Tax=Mizuhopecten yessoensis TaxID=6573 RepID=A0A210R3H7_MIZYE|nr:hypothetical protein KP79_PYT00222 [Mizuhopecten yessoensis]